MFAKLVFISHGGTDAQTDSNVISPHRNTTYVDAVFVTDRVAWSVCLSITLESPAKTTEAIEMSFRSRTRVEPSNQILDWVQIPHGKGQFFGYRVSHCKVYAYSTVNCAKTAEPIEIPFGLCTGMGPRNRVLDDGREMLMDVAMATHFWLSLGYDFGCIIASDTLFDSRGVFSGSNYSMKK